MTENSVQSSLGLICIVQGLLVWTPGLCGTNAVTWMLGFLMGPEGIFDGSQGHLEMRTVSSKVIFGAVWIVLFSRGISHHPPSTVQWKKFSRSSWNRAMCHNVHNVAGWCCWVLGYRHWGGPYLVQKWGISRNWESSNRKGYTFSKRAFINVPITVAVDDKVFAEIFRSYSCVSLPLEPAVSDWRM